MKSTDNKSANVKEFIAISYLVQLLILFPIGLSNTENANQMMKIRQAIIHFKDEDSCV